MAFEARKGHCELSTITDEVPVTLRRLRRVRDRSVISAGRVDPADRVVHLASLVSGEKYGAAQTTRTARSAAGLENLWKAPYHEPFNVSSQRITCGNRVADFRRRSSLFPSILSVK